MVPGLSLAFQVGSQGGGHENTAQCFHSPMQLVFQCGKVLCDIYKYLRMSVIDVSLLAPVKICLLIYCSQFIF